MVTKLANVDLDLKQGSVLAKILMVTKHYYYNTII